MYFDVHESRVVSMRRLSVLCLVMMLSACAGTHSFDQKMRAELVGKPLAAAYERLGNPKGIRRMGDEASLVWQKRDSESIFGPAVTEGQGYQILGTMPDGHGVYWQGITQNRCVIRASAKGDVLTDLSFEGNPGGCETILGAKKRPLGKSAY